MEGKNKRQAIIVKFCCIVASFILWLYIFNVENPIRERKIVVPVQVVNKDQLSKSKLVVTGEETFSITLDIRGDAKTVFAVKPSDFQLQSDFGSYVVKKGENKIPVEIKKSPEGIRVINNENLWIKVNLDDLKDKKVSVKISASEGKAKEGFVALQPIVKTKEVSINGPEELVSKVNSVVGKYDIKNATKDINTYVELQAQDSSGAIIKNVTIKPSAIYVTVPVKKIKSVPVSIKTQGNLQQGDALKSITSLPEKVDISGEDSIVSSIESIETEPIDLNKLNGNNNLDAKLIVPKGVNLINSNGIVKITLDLSKGGKKEISLDIKEKNLKDGYTSTLSVKKVSIGVSGNEEVINNIKPENLEAFVDLSNLDEGTYDVPINVNLPQGVSNISQSVLNVKVTIKKKVLEGKNVN